MSNLLGKLDSYQLLTNILPGAFFVWMLKFLFGLTIPSENIIENILVYYFVGLVINRISSLIVKPLLIFTRFIKYESYSSFLQAEKIDSKIKILSEANNSFRSFFTCILALPIVYGLVNIHSRWAWFAMHWEWFAILFLGVLFFFAHRKQTKYVRERVEEINNSEKD